MDNKITMNASKFTIGLTTFNRKDLLLKCNPFVRNLNLEHDYLVYDDCSSELNEDFLKSYFQNNMGH